MENISNWFWNERFWFPEGVSFDDVKSDENVSYAQPRDLFALPVYGFIVFILRHLFEKYVSNPVAAKVLYSDMKVLEKKEKKNGFRAKITTSKSNGHCEKLRNSVEKNVTRKSRELRKITNALPKIAETSWKSLYHSFSFTFGLCILLQAPWFWDTRYCWIGFPRHPLWPSLYCHYMIEGAYYIALLMCLATDVKRKDRNMMMAHHVGTINLIVFSYATNQTRIGSLLMVLHRFADMLLQIAKLLLYCKRKTIANYLFIIFVITFLITRLYVYPFYVVHTSMFKLTWYYKPYPWYYIANCIAVGLLILHIMWAYIILKMAVKVFTKGPLDRDDRSGTEDEESDNESIGKKQQ